MDGQNANRIYYIPKKLQAIWHITLDTLRAMWYNVNMNSTGQGAGAQDGSDTRMPAISDWVAGALLGCETLRIPGRRRQRQTPLLQEYQLYLCSHGATIEQVAQITGTSINRVARATHLYPNAGQPARMEDYNPHTYPEQSGGEYITAYCFWRCNLHCRHNQTAAATGVMAGTRTGRASSGTRRGAPTRLCRGYD